MRRIGWYCTVLRSPAPWGVLTLALLAASGPDPYHSKWALPDDLPTSRLRFFGLLPYVCYFLFVRARIISTSYHAVYHFLLFILFLIAGWLPAQWIPYITSYRQRIIECPLCWLIASFGYYPIYPSGHRPGKGRVVLLEDTPHSGVSICNCGARIPIPSLRNHWQQAVVVPLTVFISCVH